MNNTYAIKFLKKLNAIDAFLASSKQTELQFAKHTHSCYKGSVDLPAIRQIEKLNMLMKKSNILSFMRQAIVSAVNAIDKNARLLLVLYYVRKVSTEKILTHFGFSKRTLYRKVDAAVSMLADQLENAGFSEQYFASMINEN